MTTRDFILSDDFAKYRKELVYLIAKHAELVMFDDPVEYRGAMKLARKILHLPEQLVKTESPETEEQLRKMLTEDFKNLTVRMVRESTRKET